jgi:predicted RecB family nuclease
MKRINDRITLSPTDLSNHLGCKHLTELSREVALEIRDKPSFQNASLKALAERGLIHEQDYVKHLQQDGKEVTILPENSPTQEAIALMLQGAEVIVQASLSDDSWNGRADLLFRVDRPSPKFGAWSYEVCDTKLSVETKAGTILQLSVYSDILGQIQGVTPEWMHVIKPGRPFEEEKFRYDDYQAYYRLVKKSLLNTIDAGPQKTYPEPVEQCHVCRWWQECRDKRREDDHLSLIANIRKMHIGELNKNQVYKLEQFAQMDKPLPGKPERGHIDSYTKVHEQARMQLKGKGLVKPIYDLVPFKEKKGFNRLPEPSDGDVYFDFEGDRFYPDGGLEYLFGIVFKDAGEYQYKAYWAFDRIQERAAFNDFMIFIMDRWAKHPGMHIYHYAPYEPSAIKRLMSRYAIHETNVDKLLRGQRFVDLYSASKEILIASVESYSIKYLEKLAAFTRKCDLDLAGPARRALEYILEFKTLESLDPQTKDVVQEYNKDDCDATLALHQWLEQIRNEQIKANNSFTRPEPNDGNPKKDKSDHEIKLKELSDGLALGINPNPELRTDEEKVRWLLAHLAYYFYREEKNEWWEFFRVHKMELDEIFEEKSAIGGLTFLEEIPKEGRQKKSRYKYSFPPQEISIEAGSDIHEIDGDRLGELDQIFLEDHTLVIVQDPGIKPTYVHAIKKFKSQVLEKALISVLEDLRNDGVINNGKHKAICDLLFRNAPDLSNVERGSKLIPDENKLIERSIELALSMRDTVLAVQGPPGTGKTYTGAKMVLALLKEGKTIGVTAVSHKVIRNFLDTVYEFAKEEGVEQNFRFLHKTDATAKCPPWLTEIGENADAIDAIQKGTVLGGTTFLWANNLAVGKLNYLIVDEAGQMALANVIAASRAAHNLILLGDPQQLEQPQKGAHPEGADVAALTYFMGGQQTISDNKGIFLGITYRLHENIKEFTSELFYQKRLTSKPELQALSIVGNTKFHGAGLYYVPVTHLGRQTNSPEEVEIIKKIAESFLSDKIEWINKKGERALLTQDNILIVAPYNLQVKALMKALPGFKIGTVDKFQGQEAAIVIYSTTCSSAEDAPRGMGFLFSPNRLNVATSRAQCVCILVGSEQIFESDCRNTEQMKWVNAFCRYKEMATPVLL